MTKMRFSRERLPFFKSKQSRQRQPWQSRSNKVKLSNSPKYNWYDTNCIKLLRFVRLAQMDGSLKGGAPPELVEGLGMACRPLCKSQHLITIAVIQSNDF